MNYSKEGKIMSYYEVGTVSRISEEYEGVMPDKALGMAMMMA